MAKQVTFGDRTMAAQSVQPLRIRKGMEYSSPTRISRPLAELSPMGIRRNSPSFPQSNKNNIFKFESSPYDSSPFATNSTTSARLFWQDRDSLSSNRASIENRSPYEQEQSPLEKKFKPSAISYFDDETVTEPGTPDSVVHHTDAESPSSEIAEPIATVKAPGSGLKTRLSLTPADASTMAATRRQVSGQVVPPKEGESFASPISDFEQEQEQEKEQGHEHEQEQEHEHEHEYEQEQEQEHEQEHEHEHEHEQEQELEQDREREQEEETAADGSYQEEPQKRVSSLVQLDIPGDYNDESLGLGLEKEFDRVLQAQKRGYLMRQNTKVVFASNRGEDDVNPAETGGAPPVERTPRKISQQTWVTEPWNGKYRRRSIRASGETSPRKKYPSGPVPPLPGQASNVQNGLGAVHEDETAEEEGVDFDDDAERGRLFVKVVGAKDLDLPLLRDEQSYFALTLDNGLHCVTTSWLPLGRSAPIGQEFELVVLNDLEFQLTLQMKLEQPKPKPVTSPAKTPPSPTKKQGAFSRFFGSPRKNKAVEASRPQSPVKTQPPTAYDLVQGIVAQDGSFARAYVALSEHEKHAFGRPYSVDITCFNEWAMEEVPAGSSRTKKSVIAMQRRPPYQIGRLELQLLYIPKPKGAKDEDMPKSMNSAVRELREAETRTAHVFEGYLSQQGGDCPYWRRRLFKLAGSKLTAYHETTHQPRATINLAKASKLIDDRSTLTKKETSTKGGGRRKSAFAEEEEGYMFIEEGFRIRFANGEVIDFYADSAAQKEGWMKALSEVVGKPGSSSQSKAWIDMVLKRQRSLAAKEGRIARPVRHEISKEQIHEQMALRAAAAGRERGSGAEEEARRPAADRSIGKRSSIPVPSPTQSPERATGSVRGAPPPDHAWTESYHPRSGARSQPGSPVKGHWSREARHQKARSMLGLQWQ